MDERLKREGIKSHKQRVEEYNKYLSNLSEHHDMYVLRHSWSAIVTDLLRFVGRVSDLGNTCGGVFCISIFVHYRLVRCLRVPKTFDLLNRTVESMNA